MKAGEAKRRLPFGGAGMAGRLAGAKQAAPAELTDTQAPAAGAPPALKKGASKRLRGLAR